MEIEVVDSKSGKSLGRLNDLSASSTIEDVKKSFKKIKPALYVERQSFRSESRGKVLKDSDTLQALGLTKGGKLYFRDLGPQVGWTTRGLCLLDLHYAKRLLETIFVHRFSHATMPLRNIFKNSGYYWGFAAFVAYYNNHPLYTPPVFGTTQLYTGLAAFALCELGNLSIHVALRNLRPPGTKERRIPRPTSNPFTLLFNVVSCPNYTYEVGSWLGFSVLSQSLPAFVFTIVGFAQMAVWALGKHKNYRSEFKDYPRGRKAIIPFII